ncbi:hypothetical protein ACHAXS_014130 [Conticribra weissflogii]
MLSWTNDTPVLSELEISIVSDLRTIFTGSQRRVFSISVLTSKNPLQSRNGVEKNSPFLNSDFSLQFHCHFSPRFTAPPFQQVTILDKCRRNTGIRNVRRVGMRFRRQIHVAAAAQLVEFSSDEIAIIFEYVRP